MVIVKIKKRFVMLMPDGNFLKIHIYRRYVDAAFLEDFIERLGVKYLV